MDISYKALLNTSSLGSDNETLDYFYSFSVRLRKVCAWWVFPGMEKHLLESMLKYDCNFK